MRTIESAIAVIRNDGRYLLYWDDDWDCWLLPSRTVHALHDVDGCLRQLACAYWLPPRLFDVTVSLMVESRKPCPEHDDAIRHYVYTLGIYDIDQDADYPLESVHNHYLIDIEDWQYDRDFYNVVHLEFDIDGRTCTWWTLDEMRSDDRMRQINGDLLTTLELIETGLLPM